jgi:pimeloyl-ACP methyl ester carboxylesterase
MENPRKYGDPPYPVAVIHGGPGAAGEMKPVALALTSACGVLEPLQTESSLDGQVRELKEILHEHGTVPAVLIGFSWGAWLSFILAARHPDTVKKLILVGSGGFEPESGRRTLNTRLNRLSPAERAEMDRLVDRFENPDPTIRQNAFRKLGELFAGVDACDPLPKEAEHEEIVYRVDIHQALWKAADDLRKRGELLEMGKRIRCPVIALHGDYDPHPAKDVERPLSAVLPDFRFILLGKCGHVPWVERHARRPFLDILKKQIRS